ncbi:hypothetical protein KK103_11965 [Curtobacterium flaccumfaciens pv. flaccumfaciens]|uniref:Minor tail protein n=1 Tax=Curtobacterium flaccumfaciens pv. flaccumfaciens TaxID=138532 RepID=A0A9Q2ZL39_9MICO|nr:phage tail family protein [Curtobacterium flaccumfaciens]MBT1542481.1 hypothetical protein [Curtobacterium flaccumfaciens pv. flaccumfaciens]
MSTDWKLDCGPDGVILFGSQSSRYPFDKAPEISDAERENQDSSLPGIDGNFFGDDTTAGQTVAFGLNALGETDAEAEALYAAFRKAWRADSIRRTPGATATLTAPSGRSTFGRPRRITPAYMPIGSGAVGVTADFATQDDLWYGPEDYLQVPFALSQSGGFVFREYSNVEGLTLAESSPGSGLYLPTGLTEEPPGSGLYSPDGLIESPPGSGLYATTSRVTTAEGLRFPLVARGYTTAENTFTVLGDVPTWPIITINGPILNPTVEVAGQFRFTAATSLRYDEQLTIDTRPGRQSVLRNGTQIASLTRTSTLLPAAALPPGSHTFTLSGSSSSGAPTARIVWRAAYPTP